MHITICLGSIVTVQAQEKIKLLAHTLSKAPFSALEKVDKMNFSPLHLTVYSIAICVTREFFDLWGLCLSDTTYS